MAHQYEDPKNFLIVVVGLGSVVTLIAVMYGLSSYYHYVRDEEQYTKVYSVTDSRLTELRVVEQKKLTTYAYTSADKRSARIPIEQAMKLLVQRGRDGVPSIRPDASSAQALFPGVPTPPPAPAVLPPPATSGSAQPPADPKKQKH